MATIISDRLKTIIRLIVVEFTAKQATAITNALDAALIEVCDECDKYHEDCKARDKRIAKLEFACAGVIDVAKGTQFQRPVSENLVSDVMTEIVNRVAKHTETITRLRKMLERAKGHADIGAWAAVQYDIDTALTEGEKCGPYKTDEPTE